MKVAVLCTFPLCWNIEPQKKFLLNHLLWCKEEQEARAEWHKDGLLHINGGEIKGEKETA